MIPNLCGLVILLSLLGSVSARAQEHHEPSPAATGIAVRTTPLAPGQLWVDREEKRPLALSALYGSYATLQVLDVVSTRQAVAAGATEANPLMGSGSSARMIAVKSAATALSIYVVERTWKKNRVGAIVTMLAINGMTAAITARNYRNARR